MLHSLVIVALNWQTASDWKVVLSLRELLVSQMFRCLFTMAVHLRNISNAPPKKLHILFYLEMKKKKKKNPTYSSATRMSFFLSWQNVIVHTTLLHLDFNRKKQTENMHIFIVIVIACVRALFQTPTKKCLVLLHSSPQYHKFLDNYSSNIIFTMLVVLLCLSAERQPEKKKTN